MPSPPRSIPPRQNERETPSKGRRTHPTDETGHGNGGAPRSRSGASGLPVRREERKVGTSLVRCRTDPHRHDRSLQTHDASVLPSVAPHFFPSSPSRPRASWSQTVRFPFHFHSRGSAFHGSQVFRHGSCIGTVSRLLADTRVLTNPWDPGFHQPTGVKSPPSKKETVGAIGGGGFPLRSRFAFECTPRDDP